MMRKFLFTNLFFVAIVFLFHGCNTSPSNMNAEGSQQALAALDLSQDTIPSIDFAYKTTVLEADLPSPRKEMNGHIEDLNIRVNYGSPSVKGRKIWGELVPYDKIWRTGANEATTFFIDKSISLNNQTLEAGNYSLFSLPTAEGWELIFNTTVKQWGAYEYDSTKDVLRVAVEPQKTDVLSEMMEFIIDNDQLILLWENLRVPVRIKPEF